MAARRITIKRQVSVPNAAAEILRFHEARVYSPTDYPDTPLKSERSHLSIEKRTWLSAGFRKGGLALQLLR
jgi:hypothetical protein